MLKLIGHHQTHDVKTKKKSGVKNDNFDNSFPDVTLSMFHSYRTHEEHPTNINTTKLRLFVEYSIHQIAICCCILCFRNNSSGSFVWNEDWS